MQIRGGKLNRTNSTSPPPHYTAHTRSPFWLWQKNNNNTIVFVGFTNGRSWRTSLSPSHQPCPSVNAFERVCVLHHIPLPTNLHLFPWGQVFCLSLVLPTSVLSQSFWPYEVFRASLIFCNCMWDKLYFSSVALYINMFVPAISLAQAIMQMLS